MESRNDLTKESINTKGEVIWKKQYVQIVKKENGDDANYCEYCGTKISEVCPNCWKKEGQPNSCPGNKCV